MVEKKDKAGETANEYRTAFSQNMPVSTIQRFHEIAAELPCLKWRALEAMIWVFGSLPRDAKLRAIDGHYDVRELLQIADLIEGRDAVRAAADADAQSRPPATRKK